MLAGSGSAVLGGIGSLMGTAISAGASAHQASLNRKFQQRAMRHRYQWAMEDMKKAGLNPILAYRGIPGGIPSGNVAQMPDFGASVTRGMEAGGKASKIKRENEVLEAQQWAASTQGSLNTAKAAREDAATTLLEKQLPAANAEALFWERLEKMGIADVLKAHQLGGWQAAGAYSAARTADALNTPENREALSDAGEDAKRTGLLWGARLQRGFKERVDRFRGVADEAREGLRNLKRNSVRFVEGQRSAAELRRKAAERARNKARKK